MPTAIHRICPVCGNPTSGAEVLPAERLLVCDLCQASSPFELLPPLLFLTGASGAGKTTLYEILVGNVEDAILIEADLLWGVNPAHDNPADGYRRFRGLILHVAEGLARNGRPVLVAGSCMPEQYETLGERWYFSRTAYLAVVCSDAELERRLTARPAWRKSSEALETMLTWNRRLRDRLVEAAPPIDLVDTTDRDPIDCARDVHRWIRRQV